MPISVNSKSKIVNSNPVSIHHSQFTIHFKPGFSFLLGIIASAVILILSASQFERIRNFVRVGSNKTMEQQAINLAEAGVDYAIWKLNKNAGNFYGDGTEVAVGTTGTFFVTVEDDSPNFKTIRSTGFIPDFANKRAQSAVEVQVYVGGETIAFNYAVQIGIGGIVMSNSATINGNVYSNGPDGALKSIQGYNSSTITGDAFAVGTISTPDPWVQGTKHQNQQASQMPTVDYAYWKDKADDGGIIDCASQPAQCDLNSGTTPIGPKKYVGNFYLSNTAIATLKGPIWVTGNIVLSNSSKINLDEGFGSTSTVIITDGTFSVSNSAQVNPTSANPKGYIMVVTTSTSNTAVNLANSGSNAIIYALEGTAYLSNSAKSTALVAKKLEMANSASFTYDQGLASMLFTTGPGGSWQIRKGTYRYTK